MVFGIERKGITVTYKPGSEQDGVKTRPTIMVEGGETTFTDREGELTTLDGGSLSFGGGTTTVAEDGSVTIGGGGFDFDSPSIVDK